MNGRSFNRDSYFTGMGGVNSVVQLNDITLHDGSMRFPVQIVLVDLLMIASLDVRIEIIPLYFHDVLKWDVAMFFGWISITFVGEHFQGIDEPRTCKPGLDNIIDVTT